jgi:hypothetical protein
MTLRSMKLAPLIMFIEGGRVLPSTLTSLTEDCSAVPAVTPPLHALPEAHLAELLGNC